jgi:hypothetical protein
VREESAIFTSKKRKRCSHRNPHRETESDELRATVGKLLVTADVAKSAALAGATSGEVDDSARHQRKTDEEQNAAAVGGIGGQHCARR